jgi:hypothetical protein
MSLFSAMAHWLQQHQLPCPVKHHWHIDCPGCGLQRSFAELLQGHWQTSWHHHPATIPLLLLLVFLLVHLLLKKRLTAKILVAGYVLVVLTTVIHYLHKYFNGLLV